ncbi:hypothetical protein OS187_09430 [Xanthomonadaceae bacterium JHOS43]|nr:hypothetical protein [Xanthomonadaceae bacterium JHOS43]
MKISPLREFVLSAMLWLPLMFALWFALSSVVAFPVVRLSHLLIDGFMPGLLYEAGQDYARFAYSYAVEIAGLPGLPASKLLIDEQSVNILIYAYSMPLFCGLVAASPLSWSRTFLQWGIGLAVLVLACTIGVSCEVLYSIRNGTGNAVTAALTDEGYGVLAVHAGQAANAFVAQRFDALGISADLIALLRQFAYLILPPVVPVVMWILLNRRFLEGLVGWDDETCAAASGPSGVAPPGESP